VLLGLERNEILVSTTGSLETTAEGFDRIAKTSEEIAATADELPAKLREEVVRTLEEVDGKLANVQATLEQAEATAAKIESTVTRAQDLAGSIERTTGSFEEAGRTWDGTLRTFGETYELLSPGDEGEGGDEPTAPAPGEEAEPFDIDDYTRATESATKLAVELRSLLEDFNRTLQDDALTDNLRQATSTTLSETSDFTEASIDHLAWRAVQVIAVAFLLALGYRLVATRFLRR
jgi:hypothetical protein